MLVGSLMIAWGSSRAQLSPISRAQAQPDSAGTAELPAAVVREMIDRWNAPVAFRSSEPTEIVAGQEVSGDVAVRNGPLTLAGHVTGTVVAINTDVILQKSGRIDGDLWVVGGMVRGDSGAASRADSGQVGGQIRVYAGRLRYWANGGRIIAGTAPGEMPWGWIGRHNNDDQSWSDPLRLTEGGAYNRVEGLPIDLGPAAFQRFPWGSLRVDASLVVKTAPAHGDLGHDVLGEMRFGHDEAVGVGGHLFNTVAAVEPWQLSDLEAAGESFLFHRDYRDYYQRHGGMMSLSWYDGSILSWTNTFSDERWASRDVTDPFSVFDEGKAWRPNPAVDDGHMHILTSTLRLDTRSDPVDPWSGWFLTANVERGSGHLDFIAPSSEPRFISGDSELTYTRGVLDARRYNRLSRSVQINVRAMLAGWIGGNQMPMERRVSAEGASELPGFDFRSPGTGADVATCAVAGPQIAGMPAECDRMALGQIEYRNQTFCSPTWWSSVVATIRAATSSCAVTWVLFSDVGRGWMVGPPNGTMSYSGRALPPLGTFRTDVGGGLDFGLLSVYAAKSVSAHA
ncbi:MAG TPA: hypothetical protein VMH39_14460, partial [Gemmatimonadaceae bacterium]|nr:hypothetical protein [Gemmatimonadaceae bacterium]